MSWNATARDNRTASGTALIQAGVLGSILVWANWSHLHEMVQRWDADPRYAHGYLVPMFALVLLWLRRDMISAAAIHPSWWGLLILLPSVGLHLAAAYLYMEWFEALSLIPSIVGIALLVGGWPTLRWVWPAIGFLFFMFPLPFRVEVALAQPLQRFATQVSTFAIQTAGLPALAEGNVIVLEDDVRIGVVEACSGLSMLFTFFAISTGFVLVTRRPIPERILVIASAIPIAIFANVTRIAVTAGLHAWVGSRIANLVFHDLAGWLMMPLAVGLLVLELRLLSLLLLAPASTTLEPADLTSETMDQPRPLDPIKYTTGWCVEQDSVGV